MKQWLTFHAFVLACWKEENIRATTRKSIIFMIKSAFIWQEKTKHLVKMYRTNKKNQFILNKNKIFF